MTMVVKVVYSLLSKSCLFFFVLSGALRAKISRDQVLYRYFCIFTMLFEYILTMLLVYAMNMLYSPIPKFTIFWVNKALKTKFCMIFHGQSCQNNLV